MDTWYEVWKLQIELPRMIAVPTDSAEFARGKNSLPINIFPSRSLSVAWNTQD